MLLALNLLGIENDYVSKQEVEALVDNSTLTYVSDYFKAIMMLNVVEADASGLFTALNLMVTPGAYGQTAYGLLAMDSNTNTEDYTSFVSAALADLNTNTPYDLGLDSGGISLVALSNYDNVDSLAFNLSNLFKLFSIITDCSLMASMQSATISGYLTIK